MNNIKAINFALGAIDFKKIMEMEGMNEEAVLDMTIRDVIALDEKIKAEEECKKASERSHDAEYRRIVKKFSATYKTLLAYCDSNKDEDTLLEIISKHMDLSDIVSEQFMRGFPSESKYLEIIKHTRQSVNKRDCYGRELKYEMEYADGTICRMHNQYETCHAEPVIREFLMRKCPQFSEFDFKIYGGAISEREMEIYLEPESKELGSLYVPVRAMISGNSGSIIERNESYRKLYNHKPYDAEGCKQLLKDPVVKKFLSAVEKTEL